MNAYEGVVIEESLATRECFEMVRVRRRRTVSVGNPAPGQPQRWTVTEFDVDGADAGPLAEVLSTSLSAGPWYVDFNDGDRSYVVFAGRIFSYVRGDSDTLEQARAYAVTVGVPAAQIDWAVPT